MQDSCPFGFGAGIPLQQKGIVMLKKIYGILDKIRFFSIIGILGFIVILCVVQVCLRYFTSADIKPVAWGDEIIRLSSIWVVFLAASVGVRSGAHLSVEFFIQKYLPDAAIRIVKKAANVIVLLALVVIMWFGIIHVKDNISSSLQNLPISMALFYAAVPVGMFYLIVEYLLVLIYSENPFIPKTQDETMEG